MTQAILYPSSPRELRYVESVYYFVPGRGAWDCPALYRKPVLSRRVEAALRKHGSFESVRVNFWTGRVSLSFDVGLSSDEVERVVHGAIRAALQGELTPSATARSIAARPVPANTNATEFPPEPPPSSAKRHFVVATSFGAGVLASAYVAHRALELFPARFVRIGTVIWLVTSAGLAWVNLNESDDQIKRRRKYAVRQLYSRFGKPYRRRLIAGIATAFASRACHVASILVVGSIIDAMFSPSRKGVLGWGRLGGRFRLVELGLVSAGLIVATNLLDYYSLRVFMRAAHQISHDLRLELYKHLQSIDMRALADAERGKFLTMLHEDTNRVELLLSSIWTSSREMSFATCALISIYLQHPGFAGMVAVPLPGLLLVAGWLEKHIRPRVDRVRGSAAELGALLSAAIDGIETIRAFAQEPTVASWIADKSTAYRKNLDSTLNFTAFYDPLAVSVSHMLRSVTALAVGQHVRSGLVSTGNYVSMVMISAMLSMPLKGIARDLPHILSTLASLSRVFDVFDVAAEDRHSGEPLSLSEAAKSSISFQSVDFTYGTGHASTRILSDFSVEIPVGKVTAFVGETGSGKSTLAKLLLRFYDPSSGKILLGDRDLSKVRRTDVRRAIAYVGQEIFLFNGSVARNIAFNELDFDRERVESASRAAEAHEFIEGLPHGYDTLTGERGVKLSGGQRQRIGIARALYDAKPIVILDEATSALDAVTEASLLESLTQRLAGRTVIIIAHRLSAVKGAHRIHVLERGEIVESGDHEELCCIDGGRYATYWALQTHRGAR